MRRVYPLDRLALFVFTALVILTYIRLYYGVDFTDEAFYLALPYRFLLGGRPIVDDYSVVQLAGLLMLPFYKVFHYFVPDNTGVFIYFRHLYFLFYLSVTLLSARLLSEKGSFNLALLCSSSFLLFIPFGIPNLSYNTLGAGCFALSLVLSVFRFGRSGPWVFITGILNALAVIAYPLLLPAVLFNLIPLLYYMEGKRLRTFFTLGSAIFITSLVVYFFIGASVQDYILLIQHAFKEAPATGHEVGGGKIAEVLTLLWIKKPRLEFVALFFLFVLFVKHKCRKLVFLAPLVYSVFIFISTRSSYGGGGSSHFIIYYVLFTPVLFPLFKFDSWETKILSSVYLPCLIAGMCMAIASNNKETALANILILAMGVIQFLIYRNLSSTHEENEKFFFALRNILFVLLNCFIFIRFQYANIFQEDKFSLLNHRIKEGPYKYLKTTSVKYAFFDELNRVLLSSKIQSGTISIFPHFPAGFLVTGLKPENYNLFASCDPYVDTACIEKKSSDVVVKLSQLHYYSDKKSEFKDSKPAELIGYEPYYSSANFKVFIKKAAIIN